ncbi:unnamed protein product [Peniophora sp. CBMAI 1063]|nr:unnamed protein product [Peniophora sp. CBMAI 1063]
MRILTDLPPELLSAIVVETARIWPHLLWETPSTCFKRLEDDCLAARGPEELHYWKDAHDLTDNLCEYCTHSRLGFIALSHVSRALRAVTIGTPRLWTTINDSPRPSPWRSWLSSHSLDLLHPESTIFWIDTFLSRSRALPLQYTHHIEWDDYEENEDFGLHELFDQALPRIRTLYLQIEGWPSPDAISPDILDGAQSLQSLVLRRDPVSPFNPVFLPTSAFPQELALLNFIPDAMPWHHDAVRNLTSLKLGFAPDTDEISRASFLEFLEGLSMLRALESLFLVGVPDIPDAPEGFTIDHRTNPVDWPALGNLSLNGQSRSITAFIQCICAPAVRTVDIVYFHFTLDAKASFEMLVQWVPGLASSSTPDDIFHTASITHDDSDYSFTLGLSRSVGTSAGGFGPYTFRITADWAVEDGEDPVDLAAMDVLETFVPTLMDSLAAPRIQSLILKLDECTTLGLRQCLARFAVVSELIIMKSAARVIESMAGQRGSRTGTSRLFPALATMIVWPSSAKHKALDKAIGKMVNARARLGQTIRWEVRE